MRLKIRFISHWVVFSAIALMPYCAFGQSRLLDKKISISVSNEKIETIFKQIENTAGVSFSYNSDIVQGDSAVTFSAENKSLEKVLYLFLGKDFYFKSTGQYIIILEKKNRTEANPEKNKFNISGIVTNSRTGKPLSQATVYDMGSMFSVQTDTNGRFKLSLIPKTRYLAVRCSKTGFQDTVCMINPTLKKTLNISLLPNEKPFQMTNSVTIREVALSDSLGINLIERIVNRELLVNSRNVIMFDRGIVQLSLVPMIGTNHRLSGSVVNHFSINLLGGYSKGVAGFEAGGIININRGNVDGFQASCLINLSGKDVNGFQAAGLLNLTTDNVRGVQMSVGANFGADTVKGVQVAGLVNVCDKKLSGLQLSPGVNISRGDGSGVQVAGLANYAVHPRFQFGLVNIADTSDGAPLGLINIIRHGYYSVSVSMDELQTGYFLFNMGTRKLYSIVGISGNIANNEDSWGINYGLGSHFLYGHRLSFNVELLSSIVNAFGSFDSTTLSRVSLSTQLLLRLSKHFYLYAGPSINTFISDSDNPDVDKYISDALPSKNWHYSSPNTRYDAWIGGYAGVKYKF